MATRAALYVWIVLVMAFAAAARADQLDLTQGEYVFNAAGKGTAVTAVLNEFAATYKLKLSIDEPLSGDVTGRISAASPEEFLTKLSNIFGLAWHYNGGVLWVSRK